MQKIHDFNTNRNQVTDGEENDEFLHIFQVAAEEIYDSIDKYFVVTI